MIRKVKEGYRVVAESGRNMGTYPTNFGAVISGMDVVEKLSIGDIMQKVVIQNLK